MNSYHILMLTADHGFSHYWMTYAPNIYQWISLSCLTQLGYRSMRVRSVTSMGD